MTSSSDDLASLERTSTIARGWAVLGAVLISVTVPLLFFQVPTGDDYDQRVFDEPMSWWSAIGEVLFAPSLDFGTERREGLADDLAFARVGLVLMAVGFVLAASIGSRWIRSLRFDEVGWVRYVAAGLLVLGVVLVMVTTGRLGDPSQDDELYFGLDAAAGLLAPLALAATVLTGPGRHTHR